MVHNWLFSIVVTTKISGLRLDFVARTIPPMAKKNCVRQILSGLWHRFQGYLVWKFQASGCALPYHNLGSCSTVGLRGSFLFPSPSLVSRAMLQLR